MVKLAEEAIFFRFSSKQWQGKLGQVRVIHTTGWEENKC